MNPDDAHVDDLSLPFCEGCGRWMIAARAFCDRHPSTPLTTRALSGKGTVYSQTRTHTAMSAAGDPALPYTTLLVETDEGPRLLAHTDPGVSFVIGQRVVLEPIASGAGEGRRIARADGTAR